MAGKTATPPDSLPGLGLLFLRTVSVVPRATDPYGGGGGA